jgi:hypothetical protein
VAEYTIARGADFGLTVTIRDANGSPVDLTGRSITFTAKRSREDAVAFIQKTVGNGITLSPQSGATLGQCVVRLVPADTTGLARYSTALHYDIWLVDAGGQQHQVESGMMIVAPSITP